jgi:hypothetical protein
MREALKGDMTEIEAGIKADIEKIKGMAEQLKTFAAGSDDQIAYEKKITAAQAKIEADKQNASRELFRQESKICNDKSCTASLKTTSPTGFSSISTASTEKFDLFPGRFRRRNPGQR